MIGRVALIVVLLVLLRPLVAATLTLDPAPLAYTAGSDAVPLDAAATLTGADFSSGTSLAIAMSITAGRVDGEDLVQIRANGTVTVSSGTVLIGGIAVGTYTPNNGATPLNISLIAGTASSAVETLIQHLAYQDLVGTGATPGTRTISIAVTDLNGTFSSTRDVAVGPGNAVPVLTVGGAVVVPRTARVAITNSILQASDADHGPRQLTYELGSLPQSGNLLRLVTSDSTGEVTGSEIMGGGTTTFTQADVDGGRLRYDHLGGPAVADGFTVRVRDASGAATPLTAVTITITGAPANALITLPTGALVCTEQDPLPVAMDPPAPGTLTVSVAESDAVQYRRGELVVRLVNSTGADAGTAGDVISVRSATGTTPSAILTGYICVSGASIFIRQQASSNALPTTGTGEPDQLLGTIDAIDDGTAGKPLRIILASTVVQSFGSNVLPTGRILASENEVVTPAAVSQLIANLTVRHPGKRPPNVARSLRITLNEAQPNTGSGSAERPVTIVPVNDAPYFSPATATLTALVGRPLIALNAANDDDQPTTVALTYRLATPIAGVVVDAVSGALTWTPPDTTPVLAEIIAQDDQGADSLPLQITITPMSGPTVTQPYIITDPPVEIGGGELIFHPFTIVPAVGSGVPTSVVVQIVGDAPPGALATVASVDQLSWTLTAPGVPRPADGIYTFGLRVQVTSASGTDVGYQPITLVVLDVSGSN
jgi:Cadherin-like